MTNLVTVTLGDGVDVIIRSQDGEGSIIVKYADDSAFVRVHDATAKDLDNLIDALTQHREDCFGRPPAAHQPDGLGLRLGK